MDAQAFLDLLRGNDSEDTEETLQSAKDEDKDHAIDKDRKVNKEKNPYSNNELAMFINKIGFQVDETPRFTEMAKKMNTNIKHEPVIKDLTNFDNHDTIEDISPKNRNDSREIEKQALKKLIAKYKG